jgi:hypothetical protein
MKDSARTRLTFEILKEKQRRLREGFPQDFGLRVHRSISWIGRSEAESDDAAATFLFLWIAFNAAYADERDVRGEREAFAWFFGMFRDLDGSGRIYDAVWSRFPGAIRLFLENRFVFGPFWSHQNGITGYEDWEDRFNAAKRAFHAALAAQDTARILSMLFDRLYVLRNQLIHGGATWNSKVNRDQLRDGAEILGCLVPIMVDIMMDNSSEDWGRPFYPVVEN